MQPRFYSKRCCSSSNTAEAVANIDDLLTEILLRVPARPLVRFKCVSKHWLSLISDPKFCHHHTLRNPKTPVSAVFAGRSTEFSFVPLHLYYDPHCNHGKNQTISVSRNFNPLKFVQHLHDIVVLQSCNGLLLCCSLSISEVTFSRSSVRTTRSFYVLNPTTNQFSNLILPPAVASASATASDQLFGYALAFDPSKSPHYKVVFLQTITECAVGDFCPYYHIHIYSSENRSWRLLDSSFVRLPNVFYKQGVYCNGAVHWVGMDDEIAYYHIDDERVGFLYPPPPPPIKCDARNSRYFQASHCGSHLQLVDIYVTSLTRFEVLEMGKDYSGWFLKYHLDLNPKLAPFPCLKSYQFTVLFLVPEEVEGEESASMLLHYPGKVISYNFKTNIFKSFDLPSRAGVDDSNLRIYHYGHQYMESLACV